MKVFICPKCGAENSCIDAYCWKCGYQFEEKDKENGVEATSFKTVENQVQVELKSWKRYFEIFKILPEILAWITFGEHFVAFLVLIITGTITENQIYTLLGAITGLVGVGMYFFTKFILSVLIAPVVLQTEYQKGIHDEMLNNKD